MLGCLIYYDIINIDNIYFYFNNKTKILIDNDKNAT